MKKVLDKEAVKFLSSLFIYSFAATINTYCVGGSWTYIRDVRDLGI